MQGMKKIFFTFFIFLNRLSPLQHMNLFEPYEYLLDINRFITNTKSCCLQIGFRSEYGFDFRGYPADSRDSLLNSYNCRAIKANVAQYLNIYESDFAPFLGAKTSNLYGQFSQQFNPYQASTASQLSIFNADFNTAGVTGFAEYWLTKYLKLGYYMPFYTMTVSSLNHESFDKKQFFENAICPDIYKVYKDNAYNLGPYSLTGMGDSQVLLSWQRYFYENRDFISGIFATLRGGLYLPTGRYKDIYSETFLKIPFGYDASWGIPFGGSIEVDIGCYGGAGISADCITFFSKLMNRVIKTDMRQTDMLGLDTSVSLLKPGFKESFSVYGVVHDMNRTFLTTLGYQYNKQNESDIILCDSQYSSLIAQSANILDSWTNHNLLLIFQGEKNNFFSGALGYELFFKLGVSGYRSIVCNSSGIQLTIIF